MTEQEWLASEEPAEMVKWLRGKVSDRKLRLFALASCRWAWDLIASPENRQIVEDVEGCIDQFLGEVGMGLAGRAPIKKAITINDLLVRDLAQDDAWEAAHSVAFRVPRMCWGAKEPPWTMAGQAISQTVREVFGNPFCPVRFHPAWRTPAVVTAAQLAYDKRALPSGELEPASLAALADALEATGCKEAAVLCHLRNPGHHVRGCWALDQLMGKE